MNADDAPPQLEEEPLGEISAEETTVKQQALAKLDLLRRVQRARSADAAERVDLAFDATEDVLNALIDNEETTEDELLTLVRRRDVSAELLRRLAGDRRVVASHRLRRTLILNGKLPASAGLRLVGALYIFDLVQILVTPAIPVEVKAAAENAVLQQYGGMALGQKITLARRANGPRLMPHLFNDPNIEVVRAVLNNPFLNENVVSTAVWKASHQHVVSLIAESPKWFVRRSVKMALLHSRHLSVGRALVVVNTLNPSEIKELSADMTVPPHIRGLIVQQQKKKPI
jgi:hypothetical protein